MKLEPVRIWDVPVRIVHWLLVVLICFSWWSGTEGGNWMTYHMWSGYSILTLILFRIAWGFIGSSTARFSSFVRGPRAVRAYLSTLRNRSASGYPGHNPLGGWSVLLMMLSIALQATTGLFANDDIATEGPLYGWVSKATSDALSTVHVYNFYVLLALAGLHIAAVLFYFFYKRENLVRPMLDGRKLVAPDAARTLSYASLGRAAPVLLAVAIAVYFLVRQ